ncbi:nucleic acid-binding, OB-fold protein [Artemisia annua]|uniref:Nucleic acid-binding, OB-fold protein n=1 Tax=Artemisia annua TaxID=35608 RepID=A0A2U1NLS2_ARTAN|nr:nucleic acid-binding, OB-fold protein [Artemisia annua]
MDKTVQPCIKVQSQQKIRNPNKGIILEAVPNLKAVRGPEDSDDEVDKVLVMESGGFLDDMENYYDGYDDQVVLPDKLQAICDQFDIRLNTRRRQKMADQAITALCDVDPMLDDAKILVRVNFTRRHFTETDIVDVIGTIISISEPIPYESYGAQKTRRIVTLEDVDGVTLDCCFFDGWVDRFNSLAQQLNAMKNVVMILQNGKVKYFNGKPSVSNGAFATKLYLNDNIPEINTFRKMYQEMDGYVEKNTVLNIFSPSKKEITADKFFENAVRKMVGSICESEYQFECIVYAKIHKVHQEHGWWYLACKKCGCIAKEPEEHGESSSKKKPKTKLKAKNGEQAADIFPDELAPIVGRKLLFRFLYSSYNINNNNHVYKVKMVSADESMIKIFNHGLINEDNEGEIQTPVTPAVTITKVNSLDNIPFNIETTPEVTKGVHKDGGSGSSSGKAKRDVIDLDDGMQKDKGSKKLKNAEDVEVLNEEDD